MGVESRSEGMPPPEISLQTWRRARLRVKRVAMEVEVMLGPGGPSSLGQRCGTQAWAEAKAELGAQIR